MQMDNSEAHWSTPQQSVDRKFLTVQQASTRYGGTVSAWRKWIREEKLGTAVCRLGRLVVLDARILDERLRNTRQLLVESVESSIHE
jgi:hypothetical protein